MSYTATVAQPAAYSASLEPDPMITVRLIPVTGPQGPPGTPIVAVPYDEWPPTDPADGTLYLRLAP